MTGPRRLGVLVAAGTILALTACNAPTTQAKNQVSPDKSSPVSLPPFLQPLVAAGKLKVVRRFATDKPGLMGYVVSQNGRDQLLFAEGGYVLVGRLFSPQGQDLSARYADEYVPKPDVAATVDSLEQGDHLVVEGPDSAPRLYVFADPNCNYCHRLYKMAKPFIEAGKLQLRWAMVGFLKPTSMNKSVAILSADDPLQALKSNEAKFNVGAEEGGITPARDSNPALATLIKAHFTAMQALGGTGTPTLLYRSGTRTWASRVGLPQQDWLEACAKGKSPDAAGGRR